MSAAASTRLYESIQRSDWNSALRSLRLHPEEASARITLLPPASLDDPAPRRFLPLHSAAARNPPSSFLRALLRAHPAALREKDSAGMLPLHYACGNRASVDVLEALLDDDGEGYPEGIWEGDDNGMTPLHYAACWGTVEARAMEVLLGAAVATAGRGGERTVEGLISREDVRGMSPWRLAKEADYAEKHEVLAIMKRYWKGGDDDRVVGLQVVTAAPSPTTSLTSPAARFESGTHRRPSPRHGRNASRWLARDDAEAIVTTSTASSDKDKRVPPLPSPRSTESNRSDGSRDYPIHMMDDRRSPSEDSRSAGAPRRSDDDDPTTTRRQRYSITVSDAPHRPPSALRTESPNTPTITNMKTPRSSGRGGQFRFDPAPSPRHHSSPATRTLQSPRSQAPPSSAGQWTRPFEAAEEEAHRLRLENETLRREWLRKEEECDVLRVALSRREGGATDADDVVAERRRSAVRGVLRSLAERERALTEIAQDLQRREKRRVDRTREFCKWLEEEEGEGRSLEEALGKEMRCLEEVRDEIGRMLEGDGECDGP